MKDINYKQRYVELSDLFCDRLKEALKLSSTTQAELGSKLGKSQNAIHKWINKSGTLPNIVTFMMVCEILEIDPNYFLNRNLNYENAVKSYKNTANKKEDELKEILTNIEDLKRHIIKEKINEMDNVNTDFLSLSEHDKNIVISLIKSLKKEK